MGPSHAASHSAPFRNMAQAHATKLCDSEQSPRVPWEPLSREDTPSPRQWSVSGTRFMLGDKAEMESADRPGPRPDSSA